jgi:hypothetical protein
MSGNDIDAEVRTALLDLVLLRKPVEEATEALGAVLHVVAAVLSCQERSRHCAEYR